MIVQKKVRRDKHRDDIARKDGILVLDKVLELNQVELNMN